MMKSYITDIWIYS